MECKEHRWKNWLNILVLAERCKQDKRSQGTGLPEGGRITADGGLQVGDAAASTRRVSIALTNSAALYGLRRVA